MLCPFDQRRPGRICFALLGARLPRELAISAVFVLIGGAIVGAVALRTPRGRWRWLFIAIGAVVAGALASYVNGELEISVASCSSTSRSSC